MITLFDSGGHRNVMFHDFSVGEMVQANQHLIVDGDEGILLDPGGHKVYPKLFAGMATVLRPAGLKYLFFSHQDPDVVAAANGWLMVTDAQAYVSELWTRFIPHFGFDEFSVKRIVAIPDEGTKVGLKGKELLVLPAHFLHSPGNFQVYDPTSRILYSGDLGTAVGVPHTHVEDFDAHARAMKGFHERYMSSGKAMRAWCRMARLLDIEIMAPQHGAVFGNRALVERFIDWADQLPCGVDLLPEAFEIPR